MLDAMMGKVASNLVTYGGDGEQPPALARARRRAWPRRRRRRRRRSRRSRWPRPLARPPFFLLVAAALLLDLRPGRHGRDAGPVRRPRFGLHERQARPGAADDEGAAREALARGAALFARAGVFFDPGAAATTTTKGPASARHRTAFYATLAKLLFMDDSPARFRAFVAPLQVTLARWRRAPEGDGRNGRSVCRRGSAAAAALAAAAQPRRARRVRLPELASGIFRDLRGLLSSATSRRAYSLCFDWLHPAHARVLLAALAAWAPRPLVAVPALKFYGELALNKAQRLAFDGSSPNGILLFRELSKAVVAYGRALLSQVASEGRRGSRRRRFAKATEVSGDGQRHNGGHPSSTSPTSP